MKNDERRARKRRAQPAPDLTADFVAHVDRVAPALVETDDLARAAPTHPWDRQPGEPVHAFERFTWYLTAPSRNERRSYAKTGTQFGVSPSAVQQGATRWSWADRAYEFDRHVSRQAQEAVEDRARKATTDHLRLAERLLSACEREVVEVESALDTPDELGRDDLLPKLERATATLERIQKIMRLSLGQPTRLSAVHHVVDGAGVLPKNLSADQALALRFVLHALGVTGAMPEAIRAECQAAHFALASDAFRPVGSSELPSHE